MWEPCPPPPLVQSWALRAGSTDGVPAPSWGLSTLPAGAKGWGGGSGCSLRPPPPTLGLGRGLSGVNPCCPREKSGTQRASPPPPMAPWAGSSCQGPSGGARCQLLPGSSPKTPPPPRHWVRARSGRSRDLSALLCLNSRRNLSFNALESLSWKTVQGLSLQEL